MQAQRTEPASSGLCVAHGYGLKIYIHRGHLIVHDGIGRHRQTRRYHRVTSRLRRLVLIGHTGYITLDALRWLHDIGAALVHIDADAQLLTTSTASGPGHAALRREQALAATSHAGVEIARGLLHAKVAGQASLLPELPAGARALNTVSRSLDTITNAPDLPSLVAAEAEAASAYWDAWSELPIPIGDSDRDRDRVPAHWRTVGTRHSLLSNRPRLACNPANAILNYLYALLEAETTLACHAVGLDPLIGVFHTDQRNRASLALDAMEPARSLVDAYVLALLTQRTLARDDFAETRKGTCRLTPSLAARLAQTTNTWRHHIAPVVEGIAHTLAQAAIRPITIASPLAGVHHRAAWDARAPGRMRRQTKAAIPLLPNACGDCGTHLPDRRKRYCDECRARRWARHAAQGRDNAASVLARLRAEQRDPAHGGRAAESRGAKNAAHQAAVREWTGERPDPELFRIEILPGLRRVSIAELVGATGLSQHYCSLIRLGKRIPHPRHWDALRAEVDPILESGPSRGEVWSVPPFVTCDNSVKSDDDES
jgi:CRISPR-associated endonuclease Cas1